MADRTEHSLMRYNMGKSAERQKTIEEVLDPTYAYADVQRPLTSRISTLVPHLDGAAKKKVQKVTMRFNGAVSLKSVQRELRSIIKT